MKKKAGWALGVGILIFLPLLFLPLLRADWVDPDTEAEFLTTKSLVDDAEHVLVFSDEFNTEGRRFDDGQDPRWTAIHKNDYTNSALHYYSSEKVFTQDGHLVVNTTSEDITFRTKVGYMQEKTLTKNYQSGMLQVRCPTSPY